MADLNKKKKNNLKNLNSLNKSLQRINFSEKTSKSKDFRIFKNKKLLDSFNGDFDANLKHKAEEMMDKLIDKNDNNFYNLNCIQSNKFEKMKVNITSTKSN